MSSWRPGGGSGSFRRSGLIDGSSFRRSSGRQSSDDESGSSKPSSSSSFLRMRPRYSDRSSTSNTTSSSSLTIPSPSSTSSSRSPSFRSSSRDNKPVDRSNSWRRAANLSPVSYFTSSITSSSSSDKTKHQVQSPDPPPDSSSSKSSTLPWSYSSRSYQPINFPNPFSHSSRNNNNSNNSNNSDSSSKRVQSSEPTSPAPPASPSTPSSSATTAGATSAQSCQGSEDEAVLTSTVTSSRNSVSRTPSSASSVSWTPQSSTTSTLPSRRKVQKVQLLHLTEPCRELINPSEVVVNSSQEIFLAQPVVTPIEQLRRKDKEVARALEDKQKLIEEILNIPHEELESITENSNNSVESRGAGHRSAAEILLSALSQAKTLTSLVNKTLKLSEEEAMQAMSLRTQEEKLSSSLISEQQRIVAKGERLIEITMAINKQLTMLLTIIQENEKERESLRRELARSQDQVRCLLSGDTPGWSSVSSPLSPVTPASISPLPSPLTSKSSSPPLSLADSGECRNSIHSTPASSLSR